MRKPERQSSGGQAGEGPRKLGPYARIVKAAYDNKGVSLTWEECWNMGVGDDAIEVVGSRDLEAAGYQWSTVKQRWTK